MKKAGDLKLFMDSLIENRRKEQRIGTAHVYQSTLNRIMRFIDKPTMSFNELTPEWLKRFENRLMNDQLKLNSISTYMRALQSVYNQAVEQKQACYLPGLFKNVYKGTQADTDRSLPESVIRKIAETPSQELKALAPARDLFLLLFYLRGIPFVDLAYLRKCDLKGNTITYRRRKTGRPLLVRVEAEAMQIILRYMQNDSDSPYLLPIIASAGKDEYLQYQSALRCFNQQLTLLSVRLGLHTHLSSYCARHTWATVANFRKYDKKLISNAMGHSSIKVTETYFKAFDDDEIGRMNRGIISYVMTGR